jgi:hypothetical protein
MNVYFCASVNVTLVLGEPNTLKSQIDDLILNLIIQQRIYSRRGGINRLRIVLGERRGLPLSFEGTGIRVKPLDSPTNVKAK